LSHSWFQTSQTGGQQYSDTSPFSIPCPMLSITSCRNELKQEIVHFEWFQTFCTKLISRIWVFSSRLNGWTLKCSKVALTGQIFGGGLKPREKKCRVNFFLPRCLFTQYQRFLKIARISIAMILDRQKTLSTLSWYHDSYVIPNKLDISIIMVIPWWYWYHQFINCHHQYDTSIVMMIPRWYCYRQYLMYHHQYDTSIGMIKS
jgi:hypothetical protein